MKRRLSVALTVAALLAAAGAARAEPLALEVGQSRTLAMGAPIRQVVVARDGVVSASAPAAQQLRLTGEHVGATDVAVVTATGRREYRVAVRPAGAADADELTVHLQAEPELADVTAAGGPQGPVLSGRVPDIVAQGRAGVVASALAGAPAQNLTEVEARQVVAVDVRFVAISDTTLKALGFNFSRLGQDFEWAVVGPNSLTSFGAGTNGFQLQTAAPLQNAFNILLHDRSDGVLAALSALSDAGLSEVLAQPTLLARSGEQAEFLAGGDVPIPVAQAGAAAGAISVEYRPYGVRLAVEPYVLSPGRIVLKLAPEVSELDYANGVTLQGFSIPGFRRRSANTTVELGDGESFVIAGLTYASSNSREQRLPGIGDLPVIGALFKQAQHSREKLELIIVATPHIVSPLSPAQVKDATVAPGMPGFGDILLNTDPTAPRANRVGLSR